MQRFRRSREARSRCDRSSRAFPERSRASPHRPTNRPARSTILGLVFLPSHILVSSSAPLRAPPREFLFVAFCFYRTTIYTVSASSHAPATRFSGFSICETLGALDFSIFPVFHRVYSSTNDGIGLNKPRPNRRMPNHDAGLAQPPPPPSNPLPDRSFFS